MKVKGLKVFSMALVVAMLTTCIGFSTAVYADDAEVDTEGIKVQGAGTLFAEGDGIVLLGGKGVVRLRGHGLLWIKDVAGDAIIEVEGSGQKKEFPDGWIQYAGFHGSALVKGSKIRVVVSGVDIELLAKGRGGAILWGHGSYRINGASGRWESERLGKRVMIASDDVLEQFSVRKAGLKGNQDGNFPGE